MFGDGLEMGPIPSQRSAALPPLRLKKNRFDFVILDGDFMILNEGLCIEKNAKHRKSNFRFLVFEIWSI